MNILITETIILECDFRMFEQWSRQVYTCVAKNLKTTFGDRNVTGIKGTHLEGKTNDDVVKLFIEHEDCPYLPNKLDAFFKNIQFYYAKKSKVEHLTSTDLDGLTMLHNLDLSYNPIKRLHKDFFEGHSSIERISFYDCDLNFIEKGALDALTNLKEGHFQFNKCVHFRGDDESLISKVLDEIKSCDPAWMNSDPRNNLHKGGKNQNKAIGVEGKMYDEDEPFMRRNAFIILFFLIAIILGLLTFLYKIDAFTTLNWRVF